MKLELVDAAQKMIGQYCAIRRKELGYTQAELAAKVGCVTHMIGNFEAGKQNIAIRTFIAILRCLDMHIDLIAKDGNNPAGFPSVNKN